MSAEAFQLEPGADGTLAVAGVLTFATAQSAWRALGERLAASPGIATLDLAGVQRSDSAGLACVLAVLAAARSRGQALSVRALPGGMRRLAQVCEVESLLESA